jgi:hypothetical protein
VGKNNFHAFPRRVSRCRFGRRNNSPAKSTSICFPRRVSRCRFGGKNNSPAKPKSTSKKSE